jgi:predicted helicase
MEHKFRHEIHANEIVLLAYYIAAINIEAVYHGLQGGDYVPFEGICLTDTFQMYESDDLISHYMPDNSERRKRQKATDIRVIVGNPPYSAGQRSENDNAENVSYPTLDEKIRSTFAAASQGKGGKRALYDSYIRAIRWASDRLGADGGVVAYVSGSAWIERGFADGMRQSLAEEFSDLYIFHLRGDIRKNMLSRGAAGEGENVFGQGSMTGVAISILVKNPTAIKRGRISFFDVGKGLSKNEKLRFIKETKSVEGISSSFGWTDVVPNEKNDWIEQRDESFEAFLPIAVKGKTSEVPLFSMVTYGAVTARDPWCYNFSRSELASNASRMIDFYNFEVERFRRDFDPSVDKGVDGFVNPDPRKISWGVNMKNGVRKGAIRDFNPSKIVASAYRPFTKQWLYSDKNFVHSLYSTPKLFPLAETTNLAIHTSGVGARAGFSAMMFNRLPNFHHIDSGQCFPLNIFRSEAEHDEESDGDLFAPEKASEQNEMQDGITDAGLKHFHDAYPGETITKEDLFYYVYGLLHSEDYRAKYADNLSKELPRIPRVKTAADFWAFSRAGRELGNLHVNYETVEPYPVTYKQGDPLTWVIKDPEAFYRVTKWAFGKNGKEKDKSTVIYNPNITMERIPLEAYDYVVNGKPALEWVMERQVVKTDKDSGIVNDANSYAIETMGNPAYPLELFQRVITVSLETMKIVRGLPKLEID